MTERCVCCGAIIPEGRQTCRACEKKAEKDPPGYIGCENCVHREIPGPACGWLMTQDALPRVCPRWKRRRERHGREADLGV